MKLHVSELVLEVTRRCNMTCEHCCRGEPQNLDLSKKVINAVLDNVTSLSQITLTGGEPSLVPGVIQYCVDQIRERKIYLDGFYIVTNGKVVSKELVFALIDLYALCSDYDEGMCTFTMSRDQYHDTTEVPHLYKALKFFSADARNVKIEWDALIKDGRASGFGRRVKQQDPWEIEVDEHVSGETSLTVGNSLYIAANGNVISGCDFSYKRIDSECVGNVLKEPLIEIVSRFIKEEVEA